MRKPTLFLFAALALAAMAYVWSEIWGEGDAIYVAGAEEYETDPKETGSRLTGKAATLWILYGGKARSQALSGEKHSVAGSVRAMGNFAYVAGFEVDGLDRTFPTLWMHATEFYRRLGNSESGVATSVFVHGSNVYVAGYETETKTEANAETETKPDAEAPRRRIVTLWKYDGLDITSQRISHNGARGAYSVFASGSQVYIAGDEIDEHGSTYATLWQVGGGGIAPLRFGKEGSRARSLFVSGKDVYVAGSQGGVATLWKLKGGNIAPMRLGRQSHARSVFVSGGIAYVAGYEEIQGKDTATLWQEKKKKAGYWRLNSNEGGSSHANSVFVLGGRVYVAGSEEYDVGDDEQSKSFATVWQVKGRGAVPWRISDSPGSAAFSVFAH
jgi:3D (Asp-Asp-Asp) domain-containing protein